jgi:hypothetical protein
VNRSWQDETTSLGHDVNYDVIQEIHYQIHTWYIYNFEFRIQEI